MDALDLQPSEPFARRLAIDLAIMLAIGVLLALLGPFGSFAMPLPHRLVYWIGLAVAGYACYSPVSAWVVRAGQRLDLPEWGLWVAAVLIATVPMTLVVWSLGFVGGPGWRWPGLEEAFQAYSNVLIVGAMITLLFYVTGRRNAPAPTRMAPVSVVAESPVSLAVPVTARFLDRLPPALGSDLIALEMEDHYVRAHTAMGSALVLLRLRDALAELGDLEGAQVHRSWWVARGAVADVRRDGRNVALVLDNGLTVPVSRANVSPLKAAGWF